METSSTTDALRYHEHGDPFEVLRLESLPLQAPGDLEATVRILNAPVNPADFGRVNGTYGALASLPATGGLEGVGEIAACGRNAKRFSVGSRVIFSSDPGSWQTWANFPETKLFPAPDFLDDEQASMFWVNPATAWRLLDDFAELKEGDWIIQNAGASAVGKLVIQFAAARGIRTVNLVRNLDCKSELETIGADAVVLDNREAPKLIRETIHPERAQLGLNAVGGSSALSMCKLLARGAALVTFGGMDREPAPFPTRYLIFDDLRLRGFWVSQWYREATRERIERMHGEIAALMETQSITTPVSGSYSLDEWESALRKSQQPGKPGKVVFRMDA